MSSTIYCTYCCKEKANDKNDLPAIERYLSDRIRFVHAHAINDKVTFKILSGKFGLIDAETLIPYYDHLLKPHEINYIVNLVAQELQNKNIQKLLFFGNTSLEKQEVNSYYTAIKNACEITGIQLMFKEVSGFN